MGAYTQSLENEMDLVRQTQAGNTAAFGTLYDHYINPIYTFIYYKTHHKETAEDLTSQVFLKALKSIKSVDTDKSFGAWLYRIARNTVIDYYRTHKSESDIDDVWDAASDESDIEGDTDASLNFERVRKYFSILTEEQRNILILRIWQEKTYKEIAEIVGKTENGCKVAFFRALEKLREVMPPVLYAVLVSKLFI